MAERVRDRMAERVRDTKQLRESVREKERKRVVRVLGSARVLELGFRKITMLPMKNVKINKRGVFHVSVWYPFTGRYNRISLVRSVLPVFFLIRNKGVKCIGLLASTVWNR